MPESDKNWHLDKRVPIALIFALMAQLAGAAWLASAAFKDIETNRQGITTLSNRVEPLEQRRGAQAVQIGRIEEQISGVRSDINRMLRIIEQSYRDR